MSDIGKEIEKIRVEPVELPAEEEPVEVPPELEPVPA